MRSREEHNAQVLGVRICRMRWPILNTLMWAIPNGGSREARTGAMLKSEGVTKGVWDLMVAVGYDFGILSVKWCPGMIIEMKSKSAFARKNCGLTDEQIVYRDAMAGQEWRYEVCDSANAMVAAVERHMKEAGY